jgi:hypothetical protein
VRDRIKGKTGVDFLLTRGYNFSQILSSTILYESSNLEATITTYNQHYGHLRVAEELTDCLPLQPTITQIPNMRTVFGVIVTWYGENKEEGYAWIEIFAKGGTCVMEAMQETTLAEVLKKRDNLVTWPSNGRLFTLSVRRLTERTISVLARHCPQAPGGGFIFSYHTLRSSQAPAQKSVFGARTRHHILEINAAISESSFAD